eukprot:3507606-Rhodomonas_salina.1
MCGVSRRDRLVSIAGAGVPSDWGMHRCIGTWDQMEVVDGLEVATYQPLATQLLWLAGSVRASA